MYRLLLKAMPRSGCTRIDSLGENMAIQGGIRLKYMFTRMLWLDLWSRAKQHLWSR